MQSGRRWVWGTPAQGQGGWRAPGSSADLGVKQAAGGRLCFAAARWFCAGACQLGQWRNQDSLKPRADHRQPDRRAAPAAECSRQSCRAAEVAGSSAPLTPGPGLLCWMARRRPADARPSAQQAAAAGRSTGALPQGSSQPFSRTQCRGVRR